MKLKVLDSFLAKTVLGDDVIGLTLLKVGQYPIRAIEDALFEVTKANSTICYISSVELEKFIKKQTAVIISE